jgi:hypothetical protein
VLPPGKTDVVALELLLKLKENVKYLEDDSLL